jgi:hypothetical protein
MSTPRFVPTPPMKRPMSDASVAGVLPRSPWRTHPGIRRMHARGPGFGVPCPDAGYAMLLAHDTGTHLVLAPAE